MFGQKKQEQNNEIFWREYEEKTGEKVLTKTLGQYLSGWDEFGNCAEAPLWGLVIVTSQSLRFHHFAQHNWLSALLRAGSQPEAKEKTFCISKEQITGAEIHSETKWWKRVFFPTMPVLLVHYRSSDSTEKKLSIQIEPKTEGLIENLR